MSFPPKSTLWIHPLCWMQRAALRLMRGYAVSGGWLYLLVESDITLKTDLLALCLANGQWKALENQNIQPLPPRGRFGGDGFLRHTRCGVRLRYHSL